MAADYDVAIAGSGFGGSLLAMIARRLGRTVVLLERARHPRFAIGESTSPLANLVLEELAHKYELPRLLPLTSYGPWQRTYPQVTCGLKRGFTFYHHSEGRPFVPDPDRSNQLMVAASPCDEVADMHWLRSEVDHFFQREAVALGVDYVDEAQLRDVRWDAGIATILADRNGEPRPVRARFVVDASGPRGFLSRALGLAEARFEDYPRTQSIFSHFAGVKRCDEIPGFQTDGVPPYPADDAALHHVFDGGWMWVLRFGNGITSAGFALEEKLAEAMNIRRTDEAWERLLRRFPSIEAQFADAKLVREIAYSPRLPYRSSCAAGEGWAMLPSAAAFVDPLFSTGIPLTLLGIERLARLLEQGPGCPPPERLKEYGDLTLADADWTAGYIGACYAAMRDFPSFAALSMFYFAAASYSEMARRVGHGHLARRFLASERRDFARSLAACAHNARQTRCADPAAVRAGIEPINIAGLCDPHRRNWYPVDMVDVVRGAPKLGFTPTRMREILDAAPWAQC